MIISHAEWDSKTSDQYVYRWISTCTGGFLVIEVFFNRTKGDKKRMNITEINLDAP